MGEGDRERGGRPFGPPLVSAAEPRPRHAIVLCCRLIRFAHFLGLGEPFKFDQGDIDTLRKKLLHRMVTYKVPLPHEEQ